MCLLLDISGGAFRPNDSLYTGLYVTYFHTHLDIIISPRDLSEVLKLQYFGVSSSLFNAFQNNKCQQSNPCHIIQIL